MSADAHTDDHAAVPQAVVEAMADGRKVTYGGVSLRPPSDPTARGGSGQHRLAWTDPDTGRRRQAGATDLAKAWARTVETAELLHRRATRSADTRLAGITLGQLVDTYCQPELHARRGENRNRTVKTLLTNWVVGEHIRVPVNLTMVDARDLLVDELTPATCELILTHVRDQRSPRTYRDVHRELCTMLRWASREGLRPKGDDLPDRIGLAKPTRPNPNGTRGQTTAPVDPDDIPSHADVDRLRAVARDMHGPAAALLIDLMAYGGLRIGEALAMANDRRTMHLDTDEGVYRPHVWQRVHRQAPETRPPKHNKTRYAWLPPWLTDDVDVVLAQTPDGAPLFAAPRGGWYPVERFRTARFERWLTAADWPPIDADDTRIRKWKWTAHALRHHAATWMLNEVDLAPDDVASFLGHADGHQIWVMYSRVRPGLVSRASSLATQAGDPRAG